MLQASRTRWPRFALLFLTGSLALLTLFLFIHPATPLQAQTPTTAEDVDASTGNALRSSPYMIETRQGSPLRADYLRLEVPENRDDAENERTVEVPALRFPSARVNPGEPIFVLTGDLLTPQDNFESVSRILPYVALFNQNADVLLIGGRGVKNAQPRLACAGSYQAALTAPADPPTLVTNQGRFYTRCADFWSNVGVDVTSYNAANIAADVDAMRVALGYDSISLLGIDFGSHVGLEMLRRAAAQEPPTIARAALALVQGPDQTMKLPNDIETQLLNLNDAVLADPSIRAVIPDFLDLVSRVLARLDSQPVTVSVTDPETNQVVPITVGAFDLQYVTSRALGTGLQRQLPARYYEMDQGDFSWLGKEALAWRSEIPRNVTPLVATCASGASATRRADIEAQAEFTLLQNAVNGVTFELCDTVGEPDLGDAFRAPVESSVPVLLISGSMDGLTPPAAAEEVLVGLSEGVHVVVEGATHDLFAEALPEMTPLLLAFLAPPRALTAPAVDASNAVSDTVSSTQLSGLTQTSPLAALLATPISVPFDLEPVRIVPVEALTWRGQYFNNANLQGDPTLVRDDAAINFDWGEGSPSPEISADNFSVRWTTSRELPAGTYRFSIWVDDGARLYVDDVLVIDQWLEGPARNYVTDVNLVRGLHNIRLEYFETEGFALAQLGVSAVNAFPGWKAAYFNNAELLGEPMVVRNENDLNYIWGLQAPVVGVPSENFSARWTRNATFEANAYRFSVEVAGGVRLWLDDQLLLDDWVSAPVRVRTVDTPMLTAGSHALRVEYNKSSGNGALRVRWAPLTTPVLVPPTAVVTGDTRLLTGQAGSYDGSNSTAAVGGQIVSYTWTFGDGASGVGPIVEHIFTGTGVYNVTLTVTDDKGQSRSSTLQTRVEDQARPPVQEPPVAVIVTSGSGLVGDTMLFDAGRSVASSPLVSFAWDFGDGSTANAVQINKTYSVAGIYNVLLTVTDDQGLSSRTNRLVQIFPAPTPVPTATPTMLPTAPPLEPTPTWTPVPPVDPNQPTPTWTPVPPVDPNQPTPTWTPVPPVDPNQPTPTWTPVPPVDPNQPTPLPTEEPQIAPVAVIVPIIGGTPLEVSDDLGELSVGVAVGTPITFSGAQSNSGSSAMASYLWDLGDGTGTRADAVVTTTYGEDGQFLVQLTVTNAQGLQSVQRMTVFVQPNN